MKNAKNTAALGSAGKKLVKDYFTKCGYTIVSSRWAPTDYVDFVLKKGDGYTRVFVRTDTQIAVTGNIIVERFMHRLQEKNIEHGWLFDGKADVLCYLDANTGLLYLLHWAKLKQYVVSHCKATAFANAIDVGTVGDAYLLPAQEAENAGLCLAKTHIDVAPLSAYDFRRPCPF